MESEAARVRSALEKRENPLSEEEMHVVQPCCQILKFDKKQKVESIGTTVGGGKNNSIVICINLQYSYDIILVCG
jgi:hypothetical protein